MFILQAFPIFGFVFLTLSPEAMHFKIVDFNKDNSMFHPFVQKMRNFRNKDYIIKLLKRNLEERLRKNRKLYDDDKFQNQDKENQKFEKGKCEHCNCKCEEKNFEKRCEGCEAADPEQEQKQEHLKNFICHKEGSFANPKSCREFYICFHDDKDPIEVTCPKGFAFDADERKCTRKAARRCLKPDVDL